MIQNRSGKGSNNLFFSNSDSTSNHASTKTTLSRQRLAARLTGAYRTLHNTFARAQNDRVGRLLDAEFYGFDMPKVAEWLGKDSGPSSIVLGSDEPVIRLSDLTKYEAILARAREKSSSLRTLEDRMNAVNTGIWKCFMDAKILYRGMGLTEFSTMANAKGTVGLHRRIRYAAVNNFVSCSIDSDAAALFAIPKKKNGIVVKMDVSQMACPDYAPVTYEARRHMRVTRRARHIYNPYEMFGGRKAGMFMLECEIHLRVGSRPAIAAVEVRGERPAGFHRRLGSAVRALEATQQREIMIKYVEV